MLAAVFILVMLTPLFLSPREVDADGPSCKIVTPENGSVINLDYNEFNITVNYHVDVESNGDIFYSRFTIQVIQR